MRAHPYYVFDSGTRSYGYEVWKRTRTGHRRIASCLSRTAAVRIVRLLNADEADAA